MQERILCAMFAGLALLAPTGCGAIMSNFAGEWGQLSKDRNDVAAVKAGMRVSEVTNKIGKPERMEEGDNVYAGWQQWIYPTGYLLVYRGEVRQVYVKPRDAAVEAALAKANKKGFEFGFEDAKKSNIERDAADLKREQEELWGATRKVAKNPYGAQSKFRDGALEGFSQAGD